MYLVKFRTLNSYRYTTDCEWRASQLFRAKAVAIKPGTYSKYGIHKDYETLTVKNDDEDAHFKYSSSNMK